MRTFLRILKFLGAVLVGLVVLLFLLAAAFSVPKVQNAVAQEVVEILSKNKEIDVELQRVRYSFPNRIRLRGLLVRDEAGDTVAAVGSLKTSLFRLKIKRDRVALGLGPTEAQHLRLNMITRSGDSLDGFAQFLSVFATEKKAPSTRAFKLDVQSFDLDDFRMVMRKEPCDTCFALDFETPGLALRHFGLKGDSLGALIDRLEAVDHLRGTHVQMSGTVFHTPRRTGARDLLLETDHSRIHAELELDHPSGFAHFADSVGLELELNRSRIDLDELRPYVHDIPRLGVVSLHGGVNGTLNALSIDSLRIQLGEDLRVHASGTLREVTNPERLAYVMEIRECQADVYGVNRVFAKMGMEPLPPSLDPLGVVYYIGGLSGGLHELRLDGAIKTGVGSADTRMNIGFPGDGQPSTVLGTVALGSVDLNPFLPGQGLGVVDGQFKVDARFGGQAGAEGSVDGEIRMLEYRNYRYQNISVSGFFRPDGFSGDVGIDDPNLRLELSGNARLAGPNSLYVLDGQLFEADLHALGWVKDSISRVSALLEIDLEGDLQGELLGSAVFHRITYENPLNYYFFNDISITSEKDDTFKSLVVQSELFNGSIRGDYILKDLPGFFADYFRYFAFERERDSLRPGDFTFDFYLNNTQILSEIFMPELYVEPGTALEGRYERADDQLAGRLVSQQLSYQEHKVSGFSFAFGNYKGLPGARVRAEEYTGPGITADSIVLSVLPVDDSTLVNLAFILPDTLDHRFSLKTTLTRPNDSTYQFTTRTSTFNLGDHPFFIQERGGVLIEPNRIFFDQLSVVGDSGSATIGGSISEAPYEILRVGISGFNISVLDAFFRDRNIDLAGHAEGEIILSELKTNPRFASDLFVDELRFNQQLLGDLDIESNWSNETDLMTLRGGLILGTLQTLGFEGSYQLDSNEVDLDLGFDRFRLSTLNPFLVGVLDNLRGYANGGLHVEGKLNRLSTYGSLSLPNAAFRVPILNVDYNLEGSPALTITDDLIALEKASIRDTKDGTTGTAELRLTHDHFSDMALDLKIDAQRLLCMNTDAESSDFYYGKAYGTGQIWMHGPLNRMDIDVKARAEKGTHFVLQMGGPAEVGKKSFVEFKEPTGALLDSGAVVAPKKTGSTLALHFDLEIIPDAFLEIVMDPITGDGLKGKGKGQLSLGIEHNGELSMNGAVAVEGGSYSLTVGGLVNRSFELQKGGQLNWNGTPYDASVDLTAIYTTRTGLSPILPGEEFRSLRPDVQLSLLLSESLMNPNIRFGIKALNVSSDVESRLNNYFADPDELNKQAFSLLALNSFVSGSNVDEGNSNLVGNELTSQGLSTLGNFIFSGVNVVDVNVNYSIGTDAQTGANQEEVEVALSKKFLDDRLTVNGEFDVPVSGSASSTQQILGDVEVVYDITPDGRFKARAFNESNYRSSTIGSINAYTQGAGIFYTTDFETWNELFRKLVGRKPKPVTIEPHDAP